MFFKHIWRMDFPQSLYETHLLIQERKHKSLGNKIIHKQTSSVILGHEVNLLLSDSLPKLKTNMVNLPQFELSFQTQNILLSLEIIKLWSISTTTFSTKLKTKITLPHNHA
jgi:hypothetical protein